MREAVEIAKMIKVLGDQGRNSGNVMEALEYSQSDFQKGFELANTMQNMDLVKLLYSNFNTNTIVVEFTLLGKAEYNRML